MVYCTVSWLSDLPQTYLIADAINVVLQIRSRNLTNIGVLDSLAYGSSDISTSVEHNTHSAGIIFRPVYSKMRSVTVEQCGVDSLCMNHTLSIVTTGPRWWSD